MAGPSVPTRSWDLDVAAAAAPGFWPIVGVTPDGIDEECRRGSRSRPHRRPAKFKAVLVPPRLLPFGGPHWWFPSLLLAVWKHTRDVSRRSGLHKQKHVGLPLVMRSGPASTEGRGLCPRCFLPFSPPLSIYF